MPDALYGSCCVFFMRLSSRIWCDLFFCGFETFSIILSSQAFYSVSSSFFSVILVDLSCCFFFRSFLCSVASNFVIKRFSSVVFLRVINILPQKVSENAVAFVMNTFICFKWVTFFTLFDFVHSISARLCQLSDCHVIFNDTTRTTNEEERIKKKRIRAAERFVPNVITLIWFISQNLHFLYQITYSFSLGIMTWCCDVVHNRSQYGNIFYVMHSHLLNHFNNFFWFDRIFLNISNAFFYFNFSTNFSPSFKETLNLLRKIQEKVKAFNVFFLC